MKTIDWMLEHKGVAIARPIDNNGTEIEIIKYSEKPEKYPELKAEAKTEGLLFVIGKGADRLAAPLREGLL